MITGLIPSLTKHSNTLVRLRIIVKEICDRALSFIAKFENLQNFLYSTVIWILKVYMMLNFHI